MKTKLVMISVNYNGKLHTRFVQVPIWMLDADGNFRIDLPILEWFKVPRGVGVHF